MKMMKTKHLAMLAAVAALWGCDREKEMSYDSIARISISVDNVPMTRSSVITDEDAVCDLNIWVYASSGKLKETHYLDGLSIRSAGDVDFETSAGGHSKLVLIANAGRKVDAPESDSGTAVMPFDYPGRQNLMPLVGEGALSLTASGMRSNVVLRRAMSRIALNLNLSEELKAAGCSLGCDIRILEARLCNVPSALYLRPSAAWESVRRYKASSGEALSAGDCLSEADISTLHSGNTVYLYSLPNYTDVAYTDRPGTSSAYATYIEMTVEADALPGVSGGSAVCRFYANDGARIGLMGGCSYSCKVSFSNSGAEHHWRKEDYRFETPGPFYAGTVKTIRLHSGNHEPGGISFSLSETAGVSDDGLFRIVGKSLSGGVCNGVNVAAMNAGTGVLCAFDAAGKLMGRIPLNSEFPSFAVPGVELDVTGGQKRFTIAGMEDVYASRVSDELYEELYSVQSVAPVGDFGEIHPDDFITTSVDDRELWISSIRWSRDGMPYSWVETLGNRYPFRVTLACGTYSDFNVLVVNEVVGRFASSKNNGEVINTSSIPSPKPAVRALDGRSLMVSRTGVSMPSDFNPSSWRSAGWASWYGGNALEPGNSADSWMNVLSDGLQWNFGEAVTQSLYAKDIPVFIGKKNPWCDDYVRTCVGYYSSSYYVPAGMEYAFMQIGFDSSGSANMGNYNMEVYSMLVFREHDGYTHITDAFCKSGDTPAAYGAPSLRLRPNGTASWTENGRRCYIISYVGDLFDRFSEGMANARVIESSSAFAPVEIWADESESGSDKTRFAASAYGGNGRSNIWLYLYCPYNSDNVYAADSSGHAPQKGLVRVHLWSVSEKATFDYVPAGDWISNGYFIAPWG